MKPIFSIGLVHEPHSCSVIWQNKIFNPNSFKMNFKKIVGDVLVVTAGVALYMLAVKPMLDKAKIGS